tara:strand:- start:655 stop:1122 length:468 start_codon:yes stop_codon:yes gene_type:complete
MSKLVSISIIQDDFKLPTPEVLQEQNLAIYDLEQNNFFQLVGFETHDEIKLNISLSGNSLAFQIRSKTDEMLKTFFLSLTPLKQIINDYYTICESYFNAVKSLPIDKIESIDMGRKGIHNEGARVIIERLENRVKTDLETSRRIFTLVYALTYEK